ncbi:hypothetical protein [Ramlibacter algicola]|uniref:Uncharacterized protein n=1 Tax=Ramlibacter algicola TaxID=2795217 RepID=A0A934Q0Y0_9BURK|nr:hypothetical protein [Ramlibacter algicola]MBK0392466.1 hypothetical protein [Ramlibacter algicola]
MHVQTPGKRTLALLDAAPMRDPFDLLPLRQLVTANGDAVPAFASQPLLDLLSRPGSFRIVRHGAGGQILAGSGTALAEARRVLERAYGTCVSFGIPSVHTYVDPEAGTSMVPILFMRIDAMRSHRAPLQQVLAECGACTLEIEQRRDRVLVRAEIELSRTLDVEERIAEATGGDAHVLSWLVRYQQPAQAARAQECDA